MKRRVVRILMEKPRPLHVRARVLGDESDEEVEGVVVQDETMSPEPSEVSLSDLLDERTARLLKGAGYATSAALLAASDEELREVDGVGPKTLKKVREAVG